MALRIDVACNDPDNGIFAGRAEIISISEPVLSLRSAREPAPRFTEASGRICIVRRWWPILGSKEWVGNWCWNSYTLHWQTAIEMMVAIHKSGLFDCDEADSRLFTLWELAPPLGRTAFATALRDALRADDA